MNITPILASGPNTSLVLPIYGMYCGIGAVVLGAASLIGLLKAMKKSNRHRLVKSLILPLLATVSLVMSPHAQASTVPLTNNIVQNGTFLALWDYWQGDIGAIIGNPHAPNGVFA